MAGTTSRPDSAWVTQQGRNLSITGSLDEKKLLIRDRDAKFSGPFDEVFRTEGLRVVKTPVRAPRANAFAERWVGTVRRECLDHVLISAGVTWSTSWTRTPSATTGPGRIGASTFDRLITLPLRKEWLARESDGETSSAGSFMSTSAVRHDSYQDFGARQASSMSTNWSRDGESRVPVPFTSGPAGYWTQRRLSRIPHSG